MSKHSNTTTVTINDKDYRVACSPHEQDALAQAARYLDDKMRAIGQKGKVIGLERIAVMAALNISDELLSSKTDVVQCDQYNKQLKALNAKLEKALTQLSPPASPRT